jgi:hypothetical protein
VFKNTNKQFSIDPQAFRADAGNGQEAKENIGHHQQEARERTSSPDAVEVSRSAWNRKIGTEVKDEMKKE